MKRYFDFKPISVLLVVVLWVSACSRGNRGSPIPSATEEPVLGTPALATQIITAENIENLVEIKRLVAENAGPVAALTFAPDLKTLLVAYAREGALRHWVLVDGSLLNTLQLNPFGLGGASFDSEAKLLATSAGAEWEAHKFEDEYLDFRVWSTYTGEIVVEPLKNPGVEFSTTDIQLSPDGDWALEVGAFNRRTVQNDKPMWVVGVPPRGEGAGTLFLGVEPKPEEFDYDVLAFDSPGEFFAATNEAGKVAIYPFNTSNPFGQPATIYEPYTIIEPGNVGALGPTPLALAFDPTRHWLARVRGTELVVWDLQSTNYKRRLEASVGEVAGITASLAFNPSGELLGVGTANGWQIWNVKTGELVASGTDVEVYAVAFSPDGRLFVWGDASGVVHVWGVP